MKNENMPFGAPSRTDVVYLDETGENLVIEDLTVTDAAVVADAVRWSERHGAGHDAVHDADGVADDTGAGVPDLSARVQLLLRIGTDAVQAAEHAVDTSHTDELLKEFHRRTESMSEDAERRSAETVAQTRQAVAELVGQVERRMTESSTAVRTQLQQEITAALTGLTTQVAHLFDGDDAVVAAKLDKLVTSALSTLLEKVAQQTDRAADHTRRGLDLADPASPLSELKRSFDDQQRLASEAVVSRVKELTDKVDQVQTAMTVERAVSHSNQVTPLKGIGYADGVHRYLDQIAAACGDSYTDTSTEVGRLSRSRKGDGVLRVLDPTGAATAAGEEPPRIVIEMSNSDSVRRDWPAYLETAERNRGASASLGLVRRAEQLPGGERIRLYGPRRIVAVFDPERDDPAHLRVLVLMLRLQVLLTQGRRGVEQVRTAEDKLREANEALGKLTEVQKTATSIRKNADKIDTECGGLHLALTRLLRDALEALAAATPDDDTGSTGAAAAGDADNAA